jgi:hypothetical protein
MTASDIHEWLITEGLSCSTRTIHTVIGDFAEALKRDPSYALDEIEVKRGKKIGTGAWRIITRK